VEPTVAEPVADLPLIEPEPSISLEPTSLEVSLDATPTDGLDLLDMDADDEALQIVHSAPVDSPIFESPSAPTPDLPLTDVGGDVDSIEPAAAAALVDDVAGIVERPSAVREVVVPATPVISVETLRAAVEAAPDDWSARRTLAEALLEQGDRSEAMAELEQ